MENDVGKAVETSAEKTYVREPVEFSDEIARTVMGRVSKCEERGLFTSAKRARFLLRS